MQPVTSCERIETRRLSLTEPVLNDAPCLRAIRNQDLVKKYLELCVDLKKSAQAKDGLIQYRMVCQQVNVGSMEVVLRHFMDLADAAADRRRHCDRRRLLLFSLRSPSGHQEGASCRSAEHSRETRNGHLHPIRCRRSGT